VHRGPDEHEPAHHNPDESSGFRSPVTGPLSRHLGRAHQAQLAAALEGTATPEQLVVLHLLGHVLETLEQQ